MGNTCSRKRNCCPNQSYCCPNQSCCCPSKSFCCPKQSACCQNQSCCNSCANGCFDSYFGLGCLQSGYLNNFNIWNNGLPGLGYCGGVGGQNCGAGVWGNNLSLGGLGGIPGFGFPDYGNNISLSSLVGCSGVPNFDFPGYGSLGGYNSNYLV